MLGDRSLVSLAQFLDLFQNQQIEVLLEKHGIRVSFGYEGPLKDIRSALRHSDRHAILHLLEEVANTAGDMRAYISPKYRYDERMSDLKKCLYLDGYVIEDKSLRPLDPSINDAPSTEDDLIVSLESSDLSERNSIVQKLTDSTTNFRATPPNYNACLNDARVALESLARNIAENMTNANAPIFDPTKWGSIVGYLKAINFIASEEERGLVGVYGFVSPGSHRPIGLTEEQMARLGRSLALGMCWFLIQTYRSLAK